jgi:hypothetical protein
MQRLEKLVMSTMVPMQVIATFLLDFLSVGYVHVVLRMSSEVVGALFVDHGCISLGEE